MKTRKIGVIVLTITIGLAVMANTVKFKQTGCNYNPLDNYLSLKLSNGVSEKRVRFVDDGIIFDSTTIGMTYAKDYQDITSVTFKNEDKTTAYLVIEFKGGKKEDVGIIEHTCLVSLETFLKKNSESDGLTVNHH